MTDLEAVAEAVAEIARLNTEVARLNTEVARLNALINNPHVDEFMRAVQLEQAHQVERWGPEHDAGKDPEQWLWVLAYLATKATQAARYGDVEKYKHHIVTTAAACANWFKHLPQESEDA